MGSSGRIVQSEVFHNAPLDRAVSSSVGLAVDELFEDGDVVPLLHRLIPAREIPSMNVFWANRKANNSGALIITAAAMRPP